MKYLITVAICIAGASCAGHMDGGGVLPPIDYTFEYADWDNAPVK